MKYQYSILFNVFQGPNKRSDNVFVSGQAPFFINIVPMGHCGLKNVPVGDDSIEAVEVLFENEGYDLMAELFRHCDLVIGSGRKPRTLHLKVGYKRSMKTHTYSL